MEDKIREILNKDEYFYLSNIGVIIIEVDIGKIRVMV